MQNYDTFAKFYDAVMGSRSQEAAKIKELIARNSPQAKKILELACGTGAILKLLPKKYQLRGLDLSQGMLAIAKQKLPQAKFYHQDMARFKLPERFDVIFCVFDSLNHILKFSDWQKIFSNSYQHLNDNGVFVFDINTEQELEYLAAAKPWVQRFGRNYMIMEVTDKDKGVVNWNVKIFERQKKNHYLLFEENIKEKSFPEQKIKNALKRTYSRVKTHAAKRQPPRKFTKRLYFVCKK